PAVRRRLPDGGGAAQARGVCRTRRRDLGRLCPLEGRRTSKIRKRRYAPPAQGWTNHSRSREDGPAGPGSDVGRVRVDQDSGWETTGAPPTSWLGGRPTGAGDRPTGDRPTGAGDPS